MLTFLSMIYGGFRVDRPVTVMLTVLLLSPPSPSHQYSPLSDEKVRSMVQVVVDVTVSSEQLLRYSLLFLTFHPVETLNPSQMKETGPYSKTCSWVGTIRRAASDTEKQRTTQIKSLGPKKKKMHTKIK